MASERWLCANASVKEHLINSFESLLAAHTIVWLCNFFFQNEQRKQQKKDTR